MDIQNKIKSSNIQFDKVSPSGAVTQFTIISGSDCICEIVVTRKRKERPNGALFVRRDEFNVHHFTTEAEFASHFGLEMLKEVKEQQNTNQFDVIITSGSHCIDFEKMDVSNTYVGVLPHLSEVVDPVWEAKYRFVKTYLSLSGSKSHLLTPLPNNTAESLYRDVVEKEFDRILEYSVTYAETILLEIHPIYQQFGRYQFMNLQFQLWAEKEHNRNHRSTDVESFINLLSNFLSSYKLVERDRVINEINAYEKVVNIDAMIEHYTLLHKGIVEFKLFKQD